ncbi:MAG: Protein LemA [Candidatus Omnitrophica bacterium]|nr:Protein LemA [Candidatus Omnitrophota bacterium]
MNKVLLGFIGLVVVVGLWVGGTYNGLVGQDESVKRAWAQVENVYQRRLDLIPNLVETVKGYATHERELFTQVTEARARAAGSINLGAIEDPAKFAQFLESQQALSSALSRLLVTVENYPQLKASENFLALQSQLEGTENRIAVERGRYNEVAQVFNANVRRFPANLIAGALGFRAKEYFKAAEAAKEAPKVSF